MSNGQEQLPEMPPVWHGRRRRLLVSLVALGLIQSLFAILMALSVDALLSASPPQWRLTALLVLSVLGIGLSRWMERIVAEDLGQDYVYEQRRRLISSAILGNKGNKSLGVIMTRASNDLSAIRNWIAQGIVPMLTGLPLILVILTALAFRDWRVATAVAVPLAVTALALPKLSSAAFDRARTLRRFRGRMSAHISDTVRAGESVRVSGAVARELNAVDRKSSKVVGAAVDRAHVTGFIRALTVTAASLCTAGVVILSMLGVVDAAGVASVMTLLGVIATPMSDLGRVVEYRQNYKAARRILAPILTEAVELKRAERRREKRWDRGDFAPLEQHSGLQVRELAPGGIPAPALDAAPGERIVLRSEHPGRVRSTLQELLVNSAHHHDPDHDDGLTALSVLIDGLDYTQMPGRRRRELVGFASHHIPLERGSVRRLVSYRKPDSEEDEIRRVLKKVGLDRIIADEPRGEDTRLANDGLPWSADDVARLKLARALLGTPPLLVLENLHVAMSAAGTAMLHDVLAGYPGVVLLAADQPDRLVGHHRIWELDGESPEQREAARAMVNSPRQRGQVLDDEGDE